MNDVLEIMAKAYAEASNVRYAELGMTSPYDFENWEHCYPYMRAVLLALAEADIQVAAASMSGMTAMRVYQRDRIDVFRSICRSLAEGGNSTMDEREYEELIDELENVAICHPDQHWVVRKKAAQAIRTLIDENKDLCVRLADKDAAATSSSPSALWETVETAPHDEWLLLAEPQNGWTLKVGKASWGHRQGERGWAGYATHWMPLPSPPQTGGQIEEERSDDEVSAPADPFPDTKNQDTP